MSPISTTAMFQSVGIFSGFLLPIGVLLLFVVLVIPGLSREGMKPEQLARATYGYLAEALGIILMTAGGLPAMYAVIAQQSLDSNTYLGLLILFIIGGVTYLWHDAKLAKVDAISKSIPSALFFYSWKFIGLIIVLFTSLSFVLELLVNTGNQTAGWWNVYAVMCAYGLILTWFTKTPARAPMPKPVRPTLVPKKTMTIAAKTSKPSTKKSR